MPKIVQFNLPPGGTVVQVADGLEDALDIESTESKDFLQISTATGDEDVRMVKSAHYAYGDNLNNTPKMTITPQGSQVLFDTGAGSGRDFVFRPEGTEYFRILSGGGITSPTNIHTVGAISTAVTGTFTATQGSDVINAGSSTAFLTELHVGSAIKIPSDVAAGFEIFTVDGITSNTILSLDSNYLGSTRATSGGAFTDGGELFAVKSGDSKSVLSVNATGVLGLSTTPDQDGTSTGNNLGIGDPNMFDNVTSALRTTIIGNCRGDRPYAFRNGDSTTLIGFEAGRSLTNGDRTVVIGANANDLVSGTDDSVILGCEAGRSSGNSSTFVGTFAGHQATGANNIALGRSAGDAITTGIGNLILGYFADGVADANNQIAIGNQVVAGGASTASIGDASHVATLNFASGSQSWSTTSDSRIKENVEDAILGLDFINALRPVRFTEVNPQDWPEEIRPHVYFDKERTRKNSDGTEETYTEPAKEREATSTVVVDGLMAQEVKAAADAAGVSFSGWEQQPNGMQRLQYEKFVLPLIAACQDLSAQVTALTARVSELEAGD